MTINEKIKAMQPIARAILPPNAKAIERAILTAELARIASVSPEIILTIWNPWSCPVALLPFLAQAVSVDVWSNKWSENQKRRVIAASPKIHRLKGTRGAVETALSAFELDARLIEWWEEDARHGTFRVEIGYYNGSPIFDADLQKAALEAVIAAKPKTRVFTSRAVIKARAELYLSAVSKGSFLAIAHPFQFSGATILSDIFIGATPALLFTATAHPKI
ncbi:phage tail protein I [Bartonella sp. HY761]|uniref:phage tail protein I n=1 Tax=Bartonella sp. HY761 TaxID=2979330 RepID=UPI00220973E0|nr:phage tail protein I [Bartonella sp. HY761]UXN05262.1 phage tail protein I [Bartonella sp. HY761]